MPITDPNIVALIPGPVHISIVARLAEALEHDQQLLVDVDTDTGCIALVRQAPAPLLTTISVDTSAFDEAMRKVKTNLDAVERHAAPPPGPATEVVGHMCDCGREFASPNGLKIHVGRGGCTGPKKRLDVDAARARAAEAM